MEGGTMEMMEGVKRRNDGKNGRRWKEEQWRRWKGEQ